MSLLVSEPGTFHTCDAAVGAAPVSAPLWQDTRTRPEYLAQDIGLRAVALLRKIYTYSANIRALPLTGNETSASAEKGYRLEEQDKQSSMHRSHQLRQGRDGERTA